ncbi:MAG TPA: hypothetical protein VJ351_06055 [Streptosporangiaceae bacterium]|jgi:hypothetical protein|nr:hypothetical protein [Streptosporangiaceae bacterium]
MTQDPYGRPPGSGYVVRGEVVPDDEADVTPMTHFQKVASALRGDRTDPAMPAVQGDDPADPQATDPNGTWPGANQAAGTTSPDAPDAPDAPEAVRDGPDSQEADQYADAAQPEEVGAVRSPDDEDHDYWDEAAADRNEASAAPSTAAPSVSASPESVPAADADAGTLPTRPDAQDPTMTQPDIYGTGARPDTDAAAAGAAGVAGAGTAGAGTADAGAADAGAELGAAGIAEPGVTGKHAGAPAQEGLRPGEPDRGLGDFSDLTYGSLLPDAAEFKAQWQQVQFRFVDDPQGSVTEAADVIAQVTAKLEAAIAERQRAITERQRTLRDRWSEGKSTDTESLRETLLMYRTFLDQLTGPKAG